MKIIAKIENVISEPSLHEAGNIFNHIGWIASFNLNLSASYRYLNQYFENNDFIQIYIGSNHIAVIDKVTSKRLVIITEE